MPATYQALVMDHRSGDWRQADSKPELGRLLFGYVLGNGQKFPPRPNDIRFLSPAVTLSGGMAVDEVAAHQDKIIFEYRSEDGTKRQGELYWSRPQRTVRIR